MLLALDIGNTNVTVGVFQGEKLRATFRLGTDVRRMSDEYGVFLLNLLPRENIQPADIRKAVICSVVPPLTSTFVELCKQFFKTEALVVEAGIRTGIRILADNPREVGADRVADGVAAFKLYGGPVIVVDFGTATVFDAISKDGDYMGGAIAPGIKIAAEALFERASKLPRIDLVRPRSAVGRTTVTSMQSGLVFGYVGLVEGIVARIRREMGADTPVIATGGNADIIARETTIFQAVNPDLTLIGLRIIHELNDRTEEAH
ncbi:MAG: type III pantothenate kinase [Dehalococcoidia bacterium]|nr:type III pantothenate kinase [Dehalococcoidia bacterium]